MSKVKVTLCSVHFSSKLALNSSAQALKLLLQKPHYAEKTPTQNTKDMEFEALVISYHIFVRLPIPKHQIVERGCMHWVTWVFVMHSCASWRFNRERESTHMWFLHHITLTAHSRQKDPQTTENIQVSPIPSLPLSRDFCNNELIHSGFSINQKLIKHFL